MYRQHIVVIFVLLCSTLVSAVCFGAVTGTVTISGGIPVSGATVTFTNESNPANRFSDITDELGHYTIDLSVSTGIAENAPAPFALGQNYPNPFNPSTTIPFTLDAPAHVDLSIYNITGQRIATVIDEHLDKGIHSAIWNGYDDQGNHLGAGVYLYRLNAGMQSETRKMLLVDGGGASPGATLAGSMGMRHTSENPSFKMSAVTYMITITGPGLLPYCESGVALAGDEQFDAVLTEVMLLDIVLVPLRGGTFRMGDIQGNGYIESERPVHTVTLSPFEIGAYEITQSQYEAIMGSHPARGWSVGDTYPVYYVSWCEAAQFCNLLSDQAGLGRCYNEETWECNFSQNGFRLPTEAEWEYACRAGTESTFYTGEDVEVQAESGWFRENSGGDMHPVGQKTPNAFGLYDMYGNVLEHCHDWYSDDYYSVSPAVDPTGPSTGERRVLRGGSRSNEAETCRSAGARFMFPPIYGGGISTFGFRIARRP